MEHGFLDESNLQLQIENYHASCDKNTEHYRYGTFRFVLHCRPALKEPELSHYIELASLDTDPWMGRAALADLIFWPGLTPEQFEWLSRHFDFQPPYLQRIIQRKRLMMELAPGPLTDDLFARCLAFPDNRIQRDLLERPDLAEPKLMTLAEQGCSRAVRNMARQRLNRIVRTTKQR